MSCFMLFKDAAGCGELMDLSNLEHLINCNQDVSAHLRRYHLSKECLSECDLILLRTGYLNMATSHLEKMLVCSRHRRNLGVYWRGRTVCQYPENKGRQERAKPDQAFTLKLVKEVNNIFGVIVLIGSRVYVSTIIMWNIVNKLGLFGFPCKQISLPVLHELDAREILVGDSKGSVLQYLCY